MRDDDLKVLDRIDLRELEATLDQHTRRKEKVDRWTEFSWSVSRHRMFNSCMRRYYLHYYGARRVREADDKVVSAVWWLKQVVSREVWLGTVIHEVAAETIRALREGKEAEPDEYELIEKARHTYREGVQASRRGARFDGRWIVLFDHVYPHDVDSPDDEEVEEHIGHLVRAFLSSDAYAFIREQAAHYIYEVDEPFQSFSLHDVPQLGDVRVFAIPDVLVHTPDAITIIDWKTGDARRESIREQAGIYRFYAHQRYNLPEEKIHVWIVDLNGGGASIAPSGGVPSLAEAERFARQSIHEMIEHMEDVAHHTVSISRFPMTEDLSLCQRCGFKWACWRHE